MYYSIRHLSYEVTCEDYLLSEYMLDYWIRNLKRVRQKRRIIALSIVTAYFFLGGCLTASGADTATVSGDARYSPGNKQGILLVNSDNAYPPYEFLEGDAPTGFNIELIRAAAEVMGLKIQVRLGPWSTVRRNLETRKIDIIAGMFYSKERDELVDFSVPHSLVTSGLFVREGSPVRSIDGMRGREIIVQEGDIMHDFLKGSGIASKIIPVEDPAEGLRLLASGKHDGVLLSSEMQGFFFIDKFKLTNIKVIGTGMPPREYCFAVAEGNRQLINQLNEGLNIIRNNGRYRQIYDTWFGVYEESTWWQKTWKYLTIPLAILALLITASLVWSWLLRRRVYERTRELMESEQRLRTLFRESPAIITITSPGDGRLLEINEAFEEISGYTREEALGKTSLELGFYADPHDRERVIQEMQRFGQARNLELNLRTKTGRTIVGLFSTTPIEIKGKPCLLTIINDITERKRSEEEREKLEAQLIQSQKMEAIGSLAGGVAHDFNNILTAILGYAELALATLKSESSPNGKLIAELREIQLSAQRAAALTQQLLVFSRREMAKPGVISLHDVLTGMEKMLRRLITENISLSITSKPGIYPIIAHAHHIEQVIMNLAVNARDAMPDGGKLEIKIMETTLDETYVAEHPEACIGPHAVLTVIDTGYGMDAPTMARIFEPFFTTKERGRGTGLGLSSVYGIVKQSGGHITIYSQPGIGSTFKVFFPASSAAAVPCRPANEEEEMPGGSETVLLCEDDESVRRLSMDILSSKGYNIITAASGMDAMELAENSGPLDLLITDVVMPGMNGKMLAERLKKNIPELKVLFISGYTDDVIVHHGILDPGFELLMKPFTRAELLRNVRRILDSSQ